MYHPTTRVLAVLALLQAHQRLTGAEMARRLEVNIRTLRRYITILQDLGIPIVGERGRAGSYELTAGYRLPPMMFTNDEALALALGLLTAGQFGLAETLPAIASAQAKLEQVLPLELRERLRALTETVALDLDHAPSPSAAAALLTLSRATQRQRRVNLRYRSRADGETERELDPYGLAFRQGCWYVVGFCGLRRGLRSFRLDRVVHVEPTETTFERPAGFDPLAYLVRSLATMPRRYSFEVLLRTNFVTAQAEIFEVLGVLEPDPAGVLLRGTADDLDWLARMLARFSFDFIIRQPAELRAAVGRHAAALLKVAGQA
jgi:predicted DNA-binding transcriptional regulator YafY